MRAPITTAYKKETAYAEVDVVAVAAAYTPVGSVATHAAKQTYGLWGMFMAAGGERGSVL